MKRRAAGRAGTVMAMVAMLGGCATVNKLTGRSCDDPAMSQASRQICTDNQTFNSTVAGGAFIGAAAGALTGATACLLTGKANPLVCAGVGAGAGLFVGGVGGYLVAKKQEGASQKKRAIDAITEDVRAQNQAMQTDISSAQKILADSRRQLAANAQKLGRGEITAAQAKAERERVEADNDNLTRLIDHLKQQQQQFESAGAQSNESSPAYNTQIAQMKKQINTLTQQRDALSATLSASG